MRRLYKKLHQWPGLIVAFLLIYYSVTGIVLNHRDLLSGEDVQRSLLPKEFQYKNWNNGAIKGALQLQNDSILLYGNIGIWVTDSACTLYRPFNQGIQNGADNRKIFDLHQTDNGNIYAATQFGLYALDSQSQLWRKIALDADKERFVAIESIKDTLYAVNRSFIFKGHSDGALTQLTKHELQQPAGYCNDVSLFKTIWQIHSGEILGLPGKLFVDGLGLVTILLSVTGIIFFFFPGWIVKRKQSAKKVHHIAAINRWSLSWHNKTGVWLWFALTILFGTGMFLRPPVLIAIASAKVPPVAYSHLDQENPWYDKLRGLQYDRFSGRFLLSTSEGMYYFSDNEFLPVSVAVQPPVSVMGINVFEPYAQGAYIIGSFSGLFIWHPSHPEILNYAQGTVYRGQTGGRPVGDFKVTGYVQKPNGKQYMVDYDKGIIPLYHNETFPSMPENIAENAHMSLWNLSLEIHTGRFFRFLLADFYILLVPLSSLASVMVVLSGYLLWRKKYKKGRVQSLQAM